LSISRRFVAGTKRKLAELFGRDLGSVYLLALLIDGIETAEHTVVVALGVDAGGHKHPLGLWEGSTETKTVWSAASVVRQRTRRSSRERTME